MDGDRTVNKLRIALVSYDRKELRVQKQYLQEQDSMVVCTCYQSGGKLLEEVIRLMQLDGYEKFYLWAIDGNEIADGFYRKHGFLRTDDAVDYKIGGEPVRDVRYTRVLPSA